MLRALSLVLVAVGSCVCMLTPANAQDSVIDKNVCKLTGEAVLYFCRPSATQKYDGMSKHSITRKEDVVTIYSRHQWRGLISDADYTTDVYVEVRNTAEGLRVSAIEYDDNCLTPNLNLNKIRDFRQTLNGILRNDRDGAKFLGSLSDLKR